MQLATWWQRPDVRFLVLFGVILGSTFFVVALRPVNDGIVLPYTGMVARLAGGALTVLGEDITVHGSTLGSARFSVVIYNGCNGLVTSLIFASAVLAFPARSLAKLLGLAGGVISIQAINLIRIVSLYYTGVLMPQHFGQSHVVVWQSIVIVSGVALWLLWAHRYANPAQRSA